MLEQAALYGHTSQRHRPRPDGAARETYPVQGRMESLHTTCLAAKRRRADDCSASTELVLLRQPEQHRQGRGMDAPDPVVANQCPGHGRPGVSRGAVFGGSSGTSPSRARGKVVDHLTAIGEPAEPVRSIEQQPIRRARPTDRALTWDEGPWMARLCRIGFSRGVA